MEGKGAPRLPKRPLAAAAANAIGHAGFHGGVYVHWCIETWRRCTATPVTLSPPVFLVRGENDETSIGASCALSFSPSTTLRLFLSLVFHACSFLAVSKRHESDLSPPSKSAAGTFVAGCVEMIPSREELSCTDTFCFMVLLAGDSS